MTDKDMIYWFKKLYRAIISWTKDDILQHESRLREYEKQTRLLTEIRDTLRNNAQRVVVTVLVLSVLGLWPGPAHGQLIDKGGLTVQLLENTDYCDEDCYSVYLVCGNTISKSDVSMEYRTPLRESSIKDEKVTVTLDKGCYKVRVEGKKNRFDNIDNIPTFKGVRFDEFAWWNSSFQYCANITMDSAYVDSELTNFPAVAKFNASYIDYSHTNSDGSDIRIVDEPCSEGGSVVPYEIEEWNETGISPVHFLVSNLSDTTNTTYSVYYGNETVVYDEQNVTGLWEDAGYSMVIHMTENDPDDSTSNSNDASDSGDPTLTYECAVGECIDLDSNDYLSISPDSSMEGTSMTIEMWINPTGNMGGGASRFWMESSGTEGYNFLYNTGGYIEHNWRDTSWYGPVTYSTSFTDGTWYHVAVVQDADDDAARGELYVDGDTKATAAGSGDMGSGRDATRHAIGSSDGGSANLNGKVDEVRYSQEAKSDAWIKASYHSQFGDLTGIGAETQDTGTAPDVTLVSPENQSVFDEEYDIDFNCSVSDPEGLGNVTLYFEGDGLDWHANETTEITGTWNYSIFSESFSRYIYEDEVITWNCLAYDDSGLSDWYGQNFTLTLDYLDMLETYNDWRYETYAEDFNITFAPYSDAIVDIEASLFYDGVNEGYDYKSNAGGNITFGASVIPPLVEVNETNKTFNWVYEITFQNISCGGGEECQFTEEYNTSAINQSIVWAYYPTSASSDPPAVTEGENVTITVNTKTWTDVAVTNISIWFNDTEYDNIPNDGGPIDGEHNRDFSTAGINETVYYNGSMYVTYDGATYIRNTTTYSISVAEIILTNCSADSESQTVALEFYIYDEDTGADLTADLELSFDVWSDISNVVQYSFDFSGDNNYSVCIYPTDAEYYVDLMSQFEAAGYSPRNYYLNDAEITNTSQTISLYLGSNTTQDLISMQVLSPLGLPQEDAYINIAEYNIGSGTYTTVAIVKTDYDGLAYSYLTKYTNWYRFTIYGDDIETEMFGPLIIVDDLTFQLSGGEYGEWLDWNGQVSGGCTFPSNTTTCTVTDTSGLMASARLVVKRWTSLGYVDVCDDTDTGSSVTLVCDLGNTEGRIYWYDFSATFQNTHMTIESGYLDYSSPGTDYGDLGLIASVILILFLAFVGSWRWEIGLAGSGIGFGLGWAMGLMAVSWSSVVTVFVIIAITIYKGRTS